ncbi:MAG: cupin domain-containing protein [Chloroflexota bacterium]
MGVDEAKRTSYVHRPGEGSPIAGMGVRVKASAKDTGGQASVMEVANPGFGGPPLHLHRRHDEMLYVVEGEYLFQIDDEVIEAPAGTFCFAGRGTPHTFSSAGKVPGRLVNIGTPGGLEDYVRELDRLMAENADEETLRRHDESWDTEMVGPPISH